MNHFFNLYSSHDQWGDIHVVSDGECNYLTFGDGGQQSGMQLLHPNRLLFEYTQAMILAVLFNAEAKRATLLGLGAGSLAKALLLANDSLEIHAVELRQSVVDIAHDWFSLPKDPRLTITVDDAFLYLEQNHPQSDLLFVDLYLDNGLQNALAAVQFIEQCYANLTEAGVLVINLWDEGKGYVAFDMETLEFTFQTQSLSLVTDEGNIIVIIAKEVQADPHPRKLQSDAKKLNAKLDIPLQRLLNQLQIRG